MRLTRWAFTALALVGWAAMPAVAGEGREKCDLADVPAKVKEAAGRAAPGVTWAKACKEKEEGKTFYELCGKDAGKRRVEAEVCAADATVKEVETEVGEDAVPPEIQQIFRSRHPDFKTTGAERVMREGRVYAYDFEGKKDGKYIEYRVHTSDKSIKELTEEEEPVD